MDTMKKFHIGRILLVVYSFILSYLYVDKFFYLSDMYRGPGTIVFLALFALGFVIWNEAVMYLQKLEGRYEVAKSSRIEARFWEVILVLLAVFNHLGVGDELTTFIMHCVVVYMVLAGTGKLFHRESSIYLPGDLINGFFRTPFMNFVERIRIIKDAIFHSIESREDDETKKRISPAVVFGSIGFIIVAISTFVFVFGLLSDVDPMFQEAYVKINDFFAKIDIFWIAQKFPNFIISIFVGAYLSGLFMGSLRQGDGFERRLSNAIDANYKKIKVLPAALFYAVCAVYILMYVIFIASQARLLFSGFLGILPEEFTASRYARDGFDQLAVVIIINFLGLAIMRLLSKKSVVDSKLTAGGGIALMATSFMFAAISASKIILYISRFGYTVLRTLSLWACFVLAAGTILECVNICTSKKTFKWWMYISAASYIVMNLIVAFVK